MREIKSKRAANESTKRNFGPLGERLQQQQRRRRRRRKGAGRCAALDGLQLGQLARRLSAGRPTDSSLIGVAASERVLLPFPSNASCLVSGGLVVVVVVVIALRRQSGKQRATPVER